MPNLVTTCCMIQFFQILAVLLFFYLMWQYYGHLTVKCQICTVNNQHHVEIWLQTAWWSCYCLIRCRIWLKLLFGRIGWCNKLWPNFAVSKLIMVEIHWWVLMQSIIRQHTVNWSKCHHHSNHSNRNQCYSQYHEFKRCSLLGLS